MDLTLHRTLLWDEKVPANLRSLCRKTERLCADFRVRWWNDDDVCALLEAHSADQLRLYRGYERRIQRADFARYAILYYCGGLYLDLDIKALQPLSGLLRQAEEHDCLLCEETILHPDHRDSTRHLAIRQTLPPDERAECPRRIANYFMAAEAGSPTFQAILALCAERSIHRVSEDYDVIFTTGPDVVSTVVDKQLGGRPLVLPTEVVASCFLHVSDGAWKQGARRPPFERLKRRLGFY